MATHSSILAWRIPWTEEPDGLQSIGLQRVGHDWVTEHALFHLSRRFCCLKNQPAHLLAATLLGDLASAFSGSAAHFLRNHMAITPADLDSSGLRLCLYIHAASMEVLTMAKPSPLWDLREEPLTEVISMSDFNPCIILVLVNLFSNWADFYISKNYYLEQVHTKEDKEVLASILSVSGQGCECYSLNWNISAVWGGGWAPTTWYFSSLFILPPSTPYMCNHHHLDPLRRAYSYVYFPEWCGREIKSCALQIKEETVRMTNGQGTWLSKTLEKPLSVNIIKSNQEKYTS